jgi:hypothetical protein
MGAGAVEFWPKKIIADDCLVCKGDLMSSQTLLWRQLKVAFVPLVAAIVCLVLAVRHSGGMEGSAISGYAQNGKCFLSLGHGDYAETTHVRFEEIAHREAVVYAWTTGVILSILAAVIIIKAAGLPLEAKRSKPIIRTLHPLPKSRQIRT